MLNRHQLCSEKACVILIDNPRAQKADAFWISRLELMDVDTDACA